MFQPMRLFWQKHPQANISHRFQSCLFPVIGKIFSIPRTHRRAGAIGTGTTTPERCQSKKFLAGVPLGQDLRGP